MYCYVDESGNTGNNLFDAAQPVLYYGLLTSKTNLDVTAEPLLKALRAKLNVERLHANELGVARLSDIAPDLGCFALKRDIRFSLYKVAKPDHAIITFFDQVFDAGLNEAVPWPHYWTPLRYVLTFKVAHLFDAETAKAAWAARQETNPAKAAQALQSICSTLLDRVPHLPDARSQELVSGALTWAAANPYEIDFGSGNKDSALQISPNLVGFQQVLQYIAIQARKQSRNVRKIVVDRQTQFNKAQAELADIYRRLRGLKQSMGPGMPEMDMTNMPDVPPTFSPGDESAGLELVDVVLWVAKRIEDGKPLSPELAQMFNAFARRGVTDEVSLAGLDRRWRFLVDLPEPEGPLPEGLAAKFEEWESDRRKAVDSC
ncbi:hypothetical protein BC777_2349 [Yoonia maricola]|uniref:DUF3800 domain-containing protein n=1 Tax=Yoonia maricola TaxID=420999 RepID=A0A2M8W4Y9_9RHOB|nr:DUF3800 domain-containing protein [Yoonia maricola]PJI85995.1 hypothetical protein BC777_2349 [Yoonia maricola]